MTKNEMAEYIEKQKELFELYAEQDANVTVEIKDYDHE